MRDRRGEVLFIDARNLGTLVDRTRKEFSDDGIAKIAATYHAWRECSGYEDVAGFWWPRFQRIAPWFVSEDHRLRVGVAKVESEVPAALSFPVAGVPFKLTGRADRIDIFTDGTARIVDFKTGEPPSAKQVEIGLSPQLTLEAAALAAGGFTGLQAIETQDLLYVKLSGGEPPGKLIPVDGFAVMAIAHEHLAQLQQLLANQEKRRILQQLSQIGGVQRYTDKLRQALTAA